MARTLPSPIADTKTVGELISMVIRGRVRIPVYQRDLQWTHADVLMLFDSIYRGYPMGSLLFQERHAPAKTFELGPLRVHAPEQHTALDVVDGQQRLVALAASMGRPDPLPTTPDDNYVVYFDAKTEQFLRPPKTGEVPDSWVPLTEMADPTKLSEWVHNWKYGRDNKELRRVVFEAGSRLRGYKIPMYTVHVDPQDSDLLGEIFHRINGSGKPLKWPVIHDALYGQVEGSGTPATLGELGEALAELGMGQLGQESLLRCLIAFEGRDVTRSPEEHHRTNPDFLVGTAGRALPTLRRALGFLRDHAKIPHERLLPRTAPLVVLTRFFRLHPEPTQRSLELLTRWLWRSQLATKLFDERTFIRRGISEVNEHEERSVQRLLDFLPRTDPRTFSYPARFDARAADTRIVLLALNSLTPRDLKTGRPVDVAALIEESGRDTFRTISRGGGELQGSPANRILLPGTGLARGQLLTYLRAEERNDAVLSTHAITVTAAEALSEGAVEAFLEERSTCLRTATMRFGSLLAAWGRADRPSIDHLLAE